MKKELSSLELLLLAELEAAHLIIANAVQVMSIHQVTKLAVVNQDMDLIDSGVCRHSEREAAIKLAQAQTLITKGVTA